MWQPSCHLSPLQQTASLLDARRLRICDNPSGSPSLRRASRQPGDERLANRGACQAWSPDASVHERRPASRRRRASKSRDRIAYLQRGQRWRAPYSESTPRACFSEVFSLQRSRIPADTGPASRGFPHRKMVSTESWPQIPGEGLLHPSWRSLLLARRNELTAPSLLRPPG